MTVPESCKSSLFNPDKTVSITPVLTTDPLCVSTTGGVPLSQVRNSAQNPGCAISPDTDTSPLVGSSILPVRVLSGRSILPVKSTEGSSISHVTTTSGKSVPVKSTIGRSISPVKVISGRSISPDTDTSGKLTLPVRSGVHQFGQANFVFQL